jgi:four helix bundle protein
VNSGPEELRQRVKRFAVRVLGFVRSLPDDGVTELVGRQLARAATGISSNYRAACRGRSRAEFIAKLGIAVEEADETEHWLDILDEAKLVSGPEFEALRAESRELRAIFVASVSTARRNAGR